MCGLLSAWDDLMYCNVCEYTVCFFAKMSTRITEFILAPLPLTTYDRPTDDLINCHSDPKKMFSTVFPSHVFYLRRTFGLNPEWNDRMKTPIQLLTLTRTQHNFILKLSSLSSKNESIIKTNKQTPNSPFSYLIVPFLGLNALSISQVSWWLKINPD